MNENKSESYKRLGELDVLKTLKDYARVNLSGRHTLDEAKSREVPNWLETIKDVPQATLLFSPESDQIVWDKLISKIDEAAQRHGIELWCAVRDYPLHLTMVHNDFKELEDPELAAKAKQFANENEELRKRAAGFSHLQVRCEFPITNGNDVMLASGQVPAELVAFRDGAAELFREHGFTPVIRNHIFITIARIKHLPEEGKAEKLKAFEHDLVRIRHDISRDPLVLTADKVYTGVKVADKKREEL